MKRGDIGLCNLVQKRQQKTRKTDQVFRLGGEEFLVVLTDTDALQAFNIAQSLRISIATTASFGLAMLSCEMDRQQWLNKTDKYRYKAKQTERNKVVTPMPTPVITHQKRNRLNSKSPLATV